MHVEMLKMLHDIEDMQQDAELLDGSTSICAIESSFNCGFPFYMCVYFQTKTADVELTTWYSSTSHRTVLFSAPSPLVVPTQSSRREVTTALYISVGVSDVINNSLYFFNCLYEKFKVTEKHIYL